MQVTWRIEEMCAQELAFERPRKVARNLGQPNAACIRGKHCVRVTQSLYAGPKRALDIEVLRYCFNYPLAFANSRQMIIEVAHLEEGCIGIRKKRARSLVERVFKAALCHRIPVVARGRDVE